MAITERAGRPRSTARIGGVPVRAMLAPFPAAFFTGAWVTDIVYAQTEYLQWQYFSIWLISAGLAIGGLALLAELIDHLGDRRLRALAPARAHIVVGIVIWVLELVNAFVHSRDGWTAVVPDGIIISTVAVVLIALGGWLGATLTYRHGVGVHDLAYAERA